MKVNIGLYEDERKIDVVIDEYDTWNLDHTLALIIHPALIKLKELKQGIPSVDRADIPEHLSHLEPDIFGLYSHKELWDWILDQMIEAFDPVEVEKIDHKFYEKTLKGRLLFAKYYGALWG